MTEKIRIKIRKALFRCKAVWPCKEDVINHLTRRFHYGKKSCPQCHNLILRNGIMGYENVGGDLDKVTGKRCTFAGFPIRWEKGDGSIVRIVAIVDEGDQ